MNAIYKSILILGAGLISFSAVAQQQDSTYTRQVLLERDYNPTLNEATKINTSPNIFTPTIRQGAEKKFIEDAPLLNIKANKLGQVESGEIRTAVPFSQQRFYLKAGGGSHGNIDGILGIRAVDMENDKLDITASYAGTSGNIKYANSDFDLKKTKAKYNDLKIGAGYSHRFEPSELSIGASYQNLGFNYYGNPFQNDISKIDLDTKQKVDLINVEAGLKSREGYEGLLRYAGSLKYTNFKSKYGLNPEINKGPKGGIIDANADFSVELGLGRLGFEVGILNQAFSGKEDYTLEPESTSTDYSMTLPSFRGYTNFKISPYYKIGDLNWDVTLSANVNYVHDRKSKLVITPNLTGQIHINEVNTFYAGITGGVNNNTFVDIMNENRYASPYSRIAYSKTIYDIHAGFKSGVVPNLEFEIFGGYKQTKDDHLYFFAPYSHSSINERWGNVALPLYADVSTGHFGGQLKTQLIPLTTLSAKLVGYFYNVKKNVYDDKAWGKPSFTAELNADIKPFDKLTISLNYSLMGGRKALAYDDSNTGLASHSMKNINEFNTHVEYELLEYLSIYGRINNIFNQKYEQQYGYTLQGMNFMGGVSLKF